MRGTPRSFPWLMLRLLLIGSAASIGFLACGMRSASAAPTSEAAADEEGHAEGHAGGGSSEHGESTHEPSGDDHDSGGDHGHHDEFDLGHGNATAGLENPASWQYDTALFTAIVFLIVLAVLGKFAWRPIMDGLERRERSIAHTIAEAEKKLAQASEHLKEYEAKLASAAAEAKEIVDRAHKNAEAAAERIRREAEEAARRQRERAVQEIGLAKEQALQELADKVAQVVFGAAGKVLEREVKPQDHSRLVQEALAKLPSDN